MGIGAGIVLAVLGLILMSGVIQVDIPFVNEYTLGVILLLGGLAAIVLALTIWRSRPVDGYPAGRGRVVQRDIIERDIDDPRL